MREITNFEIGTQKKKPSMLTQLKDFLNKQKQHNDSLTIKCAFAHIKQRNKIVHEGYKACEEEMESILKFVRQIKDLIHDSI